MGEASSFAASTVKSQPTSALRSDNSSLQSAVAEASKRRLNPIKRKQIEERVTALEEEISRAEDEIARLETALQSFVSAAESQRQSEELEGKKVNHAGLLREWEELSESLQESQ